MFYFSSRYGDLTLDDSCLLGRLTVVAFRRVVDEIENLLIFKDKSPRSGSETRNFCNVIRADRYLLLAIID